jgi:hypothetical protein
MITAAALSDLGKELERVVPDILYIYSCTFI